MSRRKWEKFHAPDALTRGWSTECDQYGKYLWPTRKGAKAAIRRMANRAGMREYRCTARPGWHVGHLPQATVAGLKSTREVYGR